MSTTRRTNRVASLVQGELARLLLQEVSDPALKDIVVTEVDLSPDLKYAKVFFTRHVLAELAQPKMTDVMKGFERAKPFLRKKIGMNLELRSLPELRFIEDTHTDELNHLLHLFEDVAKQASP